jgi:hypothetical protein
MPLGLREEMKARCRNLCFVVWGVQGKKILPGYFINVFRFISSGLLSSLQDEWFNFR